MPDENYAREIMQLFSIGIFELHDDGSPIIDPTTGEPFETYTNANIQSFAKIWTGFDQQVPRGNLERQYRTPINLVDPMRVRAQWRDAFPKMDLYHGHIGDGYPICSDLGDRAFLRAGARYSFLGTDGTPNLQRDDFDAAAAAASDPARPLLSLSSTDSALFNLLCHKGSGGLPPADPSSPCTFSADVVLTDDVHCHGIECAVDTARVVQVVSADAAQPPVYYEYVRMPCVELAFFNQGYLIEGFSRGGSGKWTTQCAQPNVTAAMASCCADGSTEYVDCLYSNERVTHTTALGRCAARTAAANLMGPTLCSTDSLTPAGCPNNWPFELNTALPAWTETPCGMSVRVGPDGFVTVAHDSARNDAGLGLPSLDSANAQSIFRVRWANGVCKRGTGLHLSLPSAPPNPLILWHSHPQRSSLQ